MNKIFTFVFLIFACLDFPAFAITKCVDTSLLSSSCMNANGSGGNFYVGCSLPVNGVAFCGTGYGGDVVTEIQTSSSSGDNATCWCRMIKPVASLWVYTVSFEDEAACLNSCASRCAQYYQFDTNSFRTKMLQYLS